MDLFENKKCSISNDYKNVFVNHFIRFCSALLCCSIN